MAGKKALDAGNRRYKCLGKCREGDFANDHQQGNTVSHDRVPFVRFVADALIMGERDPAAPSDLGQPHLVGRVGSKMICMLLDEQAGRSQDLSEALTEVPVGKVNVRQAARS